MAASLFNRPGEPAFSYTRDGKYTHQVSVTGGMAGAADDAALPAASFTCARASPAAVLAVCLQLGTFRLAATYLVLHLPDRWQRRMGCSACHVHIPLAAVQGGTFQPETLRLALPPGPTAWPCRLALLRVLPWSAIR